MIARLPFAGLLVFLTCPAFAANLPAYDPARSCADAARRAGAGNAASPECIQGETEARDALAQIWGNLPASVRSRCTRLADRRQSFLILASCAEREASLRR